MENCEGKNFYDLTFITMEQHYTYHENLYYNSFLFPLFIIDYQTKKYIFYFVCYICFSIFSKIIQA